MNEDRWALVHSYRRLVEGGLASPIMCPRGDAPVVTLADTENYEPMFWCPSCDTTIRPGIEAWDQITAAVKEHSEESSN